MPVKGLPKLQLERLMQIKTVLQGLLKINFYSDATIPDSGNLANGDFSLSMDEVVSFTEILKPLMWSERETVFDFCIKG